MNLYYRIKNTIEDTWYDFRCRCQRFKRGWAYGDVWSMDYWFMRTVKPMLIHLRDNGIGIPGCLYNEEDDSRDAWEAILTEMINCLELMDEDNAEKHLGITYNDYSVESSKKTWALMEENKNRFFELFNKYFYNLWD